MSTLLEQLRDSERASKGNAKRQYKLLVKRLATGESEPTLEELLAVLDAVGKSRSDIEADIADEQRRHEFLKMVEQGEKAGIAKKEMLERVARENAKFDAIKTAHVNLTSKLLFDAAMFDGVINQGGWARQELHRLRKDSIAPELQARIKEQSRRIDGAIAAVSQQEKAIERIDELIADEQSRMSLDDATWKKDNGAGGGRRGDPEHLDKYQRRRENAVKELDRLKSGLASLAAQQEALLAEREED